MHRRRRPGAAQEAMGRRWPLAASTSGPPASAARVAMTGRFSTWAAQSAAYARAHGGGIITIDRVWAGAPSGARRAAHVQGGKCPPARRVRRQASGALQIRAACRNARHGLATGAERSPLGLRQIILALFLSRVLSR